MTVEAAPISLLQRILRDPVARRDMMVRVIIATQAREGITTTVEQAQRAYDLAQQNEAAPINE